MNNSFPISLRIAVMLPVLGQMALEMDRHPLYLMFPAALSCSMAFHTPVGMYHLVTLNKYLAATCSQIQFQLTGTPPNAIAAGIANVGVKDVVSYLDTFIKHFEHESSAPKLQSFVFISL